MKTEKDQLVQQTETQRNPYAARPEDFQVVEHGLPFNGQCGDTRKEYDQLLKQNPNPRRGKGVNLPTAVDDAEPPITGSKRVVRPARSTGGN